MRRTKAVEWAAGAVVLTGLFSAAGATGLALRDATGDVFGGSGDRTAGLERLRVDRRSRPVVEPASDKRSARAAANARRKRTDPLPLSDSIEANLREAQRLAALSRAERRRSPSPSSGQETR